MIINPNKSVPILTIELAYKLAHFEHADLLSNQVIKPVANLQGMEAYNLSKETITNMMHEVIQSHDPIEKVDNELLAKMNAQLIDLIRKEVFGR